MPVKRTLLAARCRRAAIAAAFAVTAAAAPAIAARHITYFGTVEVRPYSTIGYDLPGLLRGSYAFSATFRYDDALELISATLIVDGVLRKHFALPFLPNYAPLSIGPTSVASTVVTTPEDGIGMGVYSPSQFGGIDLLGPGHRVYITVPGDETSAFVAWTVFYDPDIGFAYNDGDGTISRVESAVPEPATWVLLIAGFAATGTALRRQQRAAQYG